MSSSDTRETDWRVAQCGTVQASCFLRCSVQGGLDQLGHGDRRGGDRVESLRGRVDSGLARVQSPEKGGWGRGEPIADPSPSGERARSGEAHVHPSPNRCKSTPSATQNSVAPAPLLLCAIEASALLIQSVAPKSHVLPSCRRVSLVSRACITRASESLVRDHLCSGVKSGDDLKKRGPFGTEG